MTLMLHCGGVPATYEQLRELPEPEPMGPRHRPVPYYRFIDEIRGAMLVAGLRIVEEAFGIALKGKHFFGLMRLAEQRSGFEVALGIRSSINKTLPMSLAIGNRVFVCDNLAFCAEFMLATRSTPKVESRLPLLTREAVTALSPYVDTMEHELAAWREDRLSDWAAERLMIAAVRTGTIPPSALGKWIKEFDDPDAEEHAVLRGTKLGLYQAATSALRPVEAGRNLNTHIGRTLTLRSMFNWPLDNIDAWEKPRIGGGIREITDDGIIEHVGRQLVDA